MINRDQIKRQPRKIKPVYPAVALLAEGFAFAACIVLVLLAALIFGA